MGIIELRSACGFSSSLMEHLERSFATSSGFCTELSEYNTQALYLKFISG